MIFFKKILDTTFGKITIITIIFSIVSSMFFFLYLIPSIHTSLIAEKKQLLHEISEEFIGILYELDEKEKQGIIDEGSAKKIAIEIINNFRYGEEDDEYFWANKIDDGTMIAHAYEHLHGDDLSTYTDPNGYNFGKDMIETIKDNDHDNNYISYIWPSKSNPDEYVQKLSHVTKFEPWGWMIGTGVYMDHVQSQITAITQKLVGVFVLILTLIIGLLTYTVKTGTLIEKQKKTIQLDFNSLIKNVPVGIFKTKLDEETKRDMLIIWNESLMRLCEIPNDKFIIKNKLYMQDFFSEKDKKNIIKRLLNEEEILGEEYKIKTIKGNDLWIKLFARATKKNDGTYVDASLEDITKKREARRKLDIAYSKLKKIDNTKSEIISITSHELRTPLTIIKGFASILGNDEFQNLTPDQKKQLLAIVQNSDNLLEMITNMLDMEKLESGKMQINREDVDLKDVLIKTYDKFGDQCKNENKKLSLYLPKSNVIINTDRSKLVRVLENIIDNAIKFTKKHEGQIEIFTKKINSDKIEIHVKDNGIGINPKDVNTIFEIFTQIDNRIEYARSGSGLGLPLSYKFIKALDGKINVHSTVNDGSDFYITLDLKK